MKHPHPTDFPKHGDDEAVTLSRSHHEVFDLAFARDLAKHHPEIWEAGGNIKGNDQFEALAPIAKRGGEPHTDAEVEAIKLREAWAARHKQDFRLAGTVAQIKWLVVGDRGEAYMKQLVEDEIEHRKERAHGDEA